MRALLAATIIAPVAIAVPVVAQQHTIGWTFDVLTIWNFPGESTVKTEPFGGNWDKDTCEKQRAQETHVLDQGNQRQPHLTANAPVSTTSVTVGATSTPGGPVETMFVTDCRKT